jgi:ribose-phosphate pyrophosphokinase
MTMPRGLISNGRTMLKAVRLLTSREWAPPICIAVHRLFADASDVLLAEAGAHVLTTNSVPHPTNAIDVGKPLGHPSTSLPVSPPERPAPRGRRESISAYGRNSWV